MLAAEALERFLRYFDIQTVLDIGSGDGQHAGLLRQKGKCVTTLSLQEPADIVGDYLETTLPPMDGIWASHVLEHTPNVGLFLEKCFRDLRPDGLLAVTVPPAKHNIVGGHLSLWNEGLLLYRLILAGFDCRHAQVGVYDYNISVLVRKKSAYPPLLAMDDGDIEKLAAFFPLPVKQGFNGQTGNINWNLKPEETWDLKPEEGRYLVNPTPVSWRHPTGKQPKTVTLIALGPSREDHASLSLDKEPPDMILTDEVWTVNRGLFHVRHDLLFVMDHLQGEAEQYPVYGAALRKHDKPIITSDNYSGWPRHVHGYPWQEIQTWLGEKVGPVHGDWWHNSVAYVLAYAAFIGVKEIRVWGADYHHHRSGRVEDGHPNAAYWVGVLERVGLVVKPIGSSTFLGASERSWIYGYHDDPRPDAVAKRQQFKEIIHAQAAVDNLGQS